MKRRVFTTREMLPSKRYRAYYKHQGRPVYAQATFAGDKNVQASQPDSQMLKLHLGSVPLPRPVLASTSGPVPEDLRGAPHR